MWLSGSRFRNRIGRNGTVYSCIRHLALDRDDVGEDVLVGEDDALGLGGRAGREDDLGGGGGLDGRGSRGEDRLGFSGSLLLGPEQLGQVPDRTRVSQRRCIDRLANQDRLRVDDAGDLQQEIGRRPVIDRNEHDPFEQRAPERGDPFRAVLAPDGDRLAGSDALVTQPPGKAARRRGKIPVSPRPRAVAVVVGEKLRVLRGGVGGDIGEEIEQRTSRHVAEL